MVLRSKAQEGLGDQTWNHVAPQFPETNFVHKYLHHEGVEGDEGY
jgi:hypothetical protein